MSARTPKPAKMELLPPEAKVPSVGNFQAVGSIASEKEMADAIKRDIEACERFGKISLFLAVRIGLALIIIKDNGRHGELTRFIDEHFPKFARSSIDNYMRVAGAFLTECKLRDAKFKLTDTARVAPILEEQLDLFTSPEAAKMQGVLKKLVQWAGKRTLQDIYKALAKGERNLPPKNFGNAGGKLHKLPTVKQRDDALEAIGFTQAFLASQNWSALYDDELAALDNLLGEFHDAVGALIRDRQRPTGARTSVREKATP